MAAPTFIACVQTASWAYEFGAQTTPSLSVQAGDILVAIGSLADAGDALAISNSGTALTWTEQQRVDVVGYTEVPLWTASADSTRSLTVTFTRTGPEGRMFGGTVYQFRGASGIGASNKANASGAPTLSLTTTQANSAIVVFSGDWQALSTAHTWNNSAGTVIEENYDNTGGAAQTIYGGYIADAGAAGAKTLGLTAPTGQKYSIVAVEVKGAAGPTYTLSAASGTFTTTGQAATLTKGEAVPAIVGVGAFTTGTDSVTPPLPSGIAAGDLLLAFAQSDNRVHGGPAGWTELASSSQQTGSGSNAGSLRLSGYWKIATGADAAPTITASLSTQCSGIVIAMRGSKSLGGVPVYDSVGGTMGSQSTSVSAPSLTTTQAQNRMLWVIGNDLDADGTNNLSSIAGDSNLQNLEVLHDETVATGSGGGLALVTGTIADAEFVASLTATNAGAASYAYMTLAFPLGPALNAYKLTAETGVFVTTGTPALRDMMIVAQPGSFTTTGQAAVLTRGRRLAAAAGAFTTTGSAAGLRRHYTLHAAAGAFTTTGSAAVLTPSQGPTHTLAAAAGSFTTTGHAATLLHGRRLAGASGAFTTTGQAAGLRRSYKLTAATGVFTTTGSAATLTPSNAAATYTLAAAAGTFTTTGHAAALACHRYMTGRPGLFMTEGADAALTFHSNAPTYTLSAQAGAFTTTGQAALLRPHRKLAAARGQFATTGRAAALLRAYTLDAKPGTFTSSGHAVALRWSGAPTPVATVGGGRVRIGTGTGL